MMSDEPQEELLASASPWTRSAPAHDPLADPGTLAATAPDLSLQRPTTPGPQLPELPRHSIALKVRPLCRGRKDADEVYGRIAGQ